MAQDNTPGDDAPNTVNLIIEIQKGGGRNKYEMDKQSGRLMLDRVNLTTLGYPADYGYVPGTLCDDGDPLDALLVIDESVPPATLVPARPIGILYMVDDGESDEKLICVPTKDASKDSIQQVSDLGPNFSKQVEHFYSHYKDWKNDWQGVKVSFNGWGDAAAAKEFITKSVERYKQAGNSH